MKTILHSLFLVLSLSAGPAVLAAQAVEPAMSLEQAVTQVQRETGGKVLSASTVRRGRSAFEHRVKVLTPTGHVRVVTVTSEAARPASNDSKNPSSDGDSNKEKH